MTKKEINAEIDSDLPEVKKYIDSATDHYDKRFRKRKITKPVMRNYYTSNRNHWLVVMFWHNDTTQIGFGVYVPEKEKNRYLFAFITRDIENERASVTYLTKHFFDRYSERRNLDLDRDNTIREFIVQDGFFTDVDRHEIDEYVGGITCKSRNGILLGYWDGNIPATIINTFVSKEMVFEGQIPDGDETAEFITKQYVDLNITEIDPIKRKWNSEDYLKFVENLDW
ncbi:hypothetical protein ACFLU5_16980 [Bacteroidota bacterium]